MSSSRLLGGQLRRVTENQEAEPSQLYRKDQFLAITFSL